MLEECMALESIINRVERNIPRTINKVDKEVRRTAGRLEDTFDSLKNVAYDGLHLGVGLVAMVSENLSSFFKDTVEYGEKVEKRQLRKLSELRSDAVKRVKGIFSQTEDMAENAYEDVINELEIPKKSAFRSLTRKVNKVKRATAARAKSTAKSTRSNGKGTKKSKTAKTARLAASKTSSAKSRTTKKAHRTTSPKTTTRRTTKGAKSRARR
jgi:polyhydroxyalkanoate synthesis regulator phasin